MHTTAANILKILSQSEMSVDDMQLYLEVEKSSIMKAILQLNEFLESINLPIIKRNDSLCSLNLSNQQMKTLFNNFNTLTSVEKVDYLFIKFIATGFLNLEKEKENLDISRSTILRAFKTVKETFAKNGSTYEYIHGKGLVLTHLSSLDKTAFCKKLMIFFIEEDILVPSRRNLLNSIKKFDTKERVEKLYPILSNSEMSVNYFVLAFIHVLEVCVDIFGGFDFKVESIKEMDKFIKIKNSVEKCGKELSEEYKKQLVYFLYSFSLDQGRLDGTLINISSKFISDLKDYFKLKINNKDLYKLLFNKVYLSFFKLENNILKISNIKRDRSYMKILEKLDIFLAENSYKIYLADKYVIAFVLKTIIIEENISEIKNVLLLLHDAAINRKSAFNISLKRYIPAVNFDVEPILFYQKNVAKLKKDYDIIIADSKISYESILIDSYNNIKIYEILENHALNVGLNKK
ncbi:hypothetical protein NON08_00505 [Cetobacterium somerae]|uniref:hypothetical protein n=1 Tax=Cetobacterium sp. NK01 TaxID=2993530 RepID=UPI002116E3DE|nr:hypothetical protein [Cetobacterium sp. NK01]MCQ8211052.1 hypothetical protein [Cetobacterium sp. NK01]